MANNLEHSHAPEAIRRRLALEHRPSYLRDAILGGIDGCVTTVAVVASVFGAGLPGMVAFVLGMASLVADAFSMAVSNYQAVKSDHDNREQLREQEARHIDEEPEGEREEIRQIFRHKGFDGETLERIVSTITSNRELWIDTMVQEEYGHSLNGPVPWRAGLATFLMFVIVGLVPLLPFLIPVLAGNEVFLASAVAALLALFAVGWVKGMVLGMSRFKAGAETLLMGGGAALVAFLFGIFLEPMLGDISFD